MRNDIKLHLVQGIIPFWKTLRDDTYGGYYGFMDFDRNVDKKAVKGCILNSRITWFFSSAYQLLGDASLLEEARHGYRFLKEHCLQADISVPVILVGTIGSGLCALILEFFCFHVDYKRTEYLEYQDDAYVYYVKAVPKQAAANSGSTWHSTGNRVKKRNIPDHDEMKRKDKETSTKNLSEEGLHIAEQFRTTEKPIKKEPEDTQEIFPDIDFEAKLEETLHDIDKDIK